MVIDDGNEALIRSPESQSNQKAPESRQSPKTKTATHRLNARSLEAIKCYCLKKYGSLNSVGKEISNAIDFFLARKDKEQSFTILSNAQHGRITIMRLNALMVAIAKAHNWHQPPLMLHDSIVELTKSTLHVKSDSRIKHYITLLLQRGMARTTRVNQDTGKIEVVYNIAVFTRMSHYNSCFKDINRTETSSIVENAGRHSRSEDQSKPENNRVGLKREQGEGKYKDA